MNETIIDKINIIPIYRLEASFLGFITPFIVIGSLKSFISQFFFPSCPFCLAKCKQRIRNNFVTLLPKVTKNQKRKMGWTKTITYWQNQYFSDLQVGSFVPWLYYSFYCDRKPQIIYLSIVIGLGIGAVVVSTFDFFAGPRFRPLRAGNYCSYANIIIV